MFSRLFIAWHESISQLLIKYTSALASALKRGVSTENNQYSSDLIECVYGIQILWQNCSEIVFLIKNCSYFYSETLFC